MSVTSYYQGNLIDVSATFENEAGTPTDPTGITFVWNCG